MEATRFVRPSGRFTGGDGPKIVGPTGGEAVDIASIGVRFMIWGEESGGDFSLVEHPIPPKGLAAPLHRHSREDEYSFVLEGRMGAQLGDEVVYAEVGDLAFKPRNQWHTFWNAAEEPCRILEIISPAGFEGFFAELAEILGRAGGELDAQAEADRAALGDRYGVELDPGSMPRLCAEHGLRFPGFDPGEATG